MSDQFAWTPEGRAAFQAVLDAKRRLDAERRAVRLAQEKAGAAAAQLPPPVNSTVAEPVSL